ncbi:MAG: ATP-binding protein [Bdellovibrionaceae bacterium]|nr:ATP-binding protein [Pseudobdellovibrionaceae bacterium]
MITCDTSIHTCACQRENHDCKRVVLTGGPGAGKTAVLEIARKNFCEHISILPEAASIIFGGGFLRHETLPAKKAAQRAIFSVQKELERLVEEEKKSAIMLCDRGTLDGLAYWPDDEALYWKELGTTKADEFSRYAAVIHLRTPQLEQGYNHQNPVRIESAIQASEIDEKIAQAWSGHPRRFFVESNSEFLEKVAQTIALIKEELPECCKGHSIQELKNRT